MVTVTMETKKGEVLNLLTSKPIAFEVSIHMYITWKFFNIKVDGYIANSKVARERIALNKR